MKKVIILVCIVVFTLSCKAQILPVEKVIDYIENEDLDMPENITHIKDVNNLLNKFVGTWEGTFDNKSFELLISKHVSIFDGVSEDQLLMKYKIVGANNLIIENTLTLSNSNTLVVNGGYLKRNGTYVLQPYSGRNSKCGQGGDLFLQPFGASTMKLFLAPMMELLNAKDCPNGEAAQIFPVKEAMILTKQP